MAAKRTVIYFNVEPKTRNRFKAAAALSGKSLRAWALEAMQEKAEQDLAAALGPGETGGETKERKPTGEGTDGGIRLQEVLTTLSRHTNDITEMGARSLAVFGSVARGEASPDSDVDLLSEFERPFGLFKFMELKSYLEEILGSRVDLITPDSLHPALRDRILGEAVSAT